MDMTPEMIAEIEQGLIDRTDGFCFRIDQDTSGDTGTQAFGVVIVDSHGCALTVECRIADDGTAQITASKHAENGARLDPSVFTMPGSVLVST